MAEQGVTVVVPTLNRGGFLLNCVQDLIAQDHRPLEILIVDQSPEPARALLELAREWPDLVTYHRVGFRGLPEARNYGWQGARYDAIVFVDDDIRCGPDLVLEHLRALRLPGVGVVAGGIDEPGRPADGRVTAGTFRRWTATPLRGFASAAEHDVDHAQGCNFSAWRRALEAAGGFDERLNVGAALYEEADFCLRAGRAGYRVYFSGKARVVHLGAAAGGCRVGDVVGYVRGLAHNRAVLIRRHVRWFEVPTALMRLAIMGCAFAVHYGTPGALPACARGALEGWRDGALPVGCGGCQTDLRGRESRG